MRRDLSTFLSRLPIPARSALRRIAYAHRDLRDRFRTAPRRIIWILAHMRSGSTLLMHILSSHPEILGAGERNAVYETAADLRKLEVVAFAARWQFLRDYDFVVDQINHSRFLAQEDLLNHPRVSKIFLIREPAPAVASMVQVLGRFHGLGVEDSVRYYLERLAALERHARRVEDRDSAFFLTYESLIDTPQPVLRALGSFLGLGSELRDTYRTFGFTGSRGDPSNRIRTGRIDGNLPRRRIELDPATLDRLVAAHARCRDRLGRCCVSAPSAR